MITPEQYALAQEVVDVAKINIVNCGMCGGIVLHRMENDEITCPHCNFEGEPCDFPDFFHV